MLDDLLSGWAKLREKVSAERRSVLEAKINALSMAADSKDSAELRREVRVLLEDLGPEGIELASEVA